MAVIKDEYIAEAELGEILFQFPEVNSNTWEDDWADWVRGVAGDEIENSPISWVRSKVEFEKFCLNYLPRRYRESFFPQRLVLGLFNDWDPYVYPNSNDSTGHSYYSLGSFDANESYSPDMILSQITDFSWSGSPFHRYHSEEIFCPELNFKVLWDDSNTIATIFLKSYKLNLLSVGVHDVNSTPYLYLNDSSDWWLWRSREGLYSFEQTALPLVLTGLYNGLPILSF